MRAGAQVEGNGANDGSSTGALCRSEIESEPGGLTREVETPLPSTHPQLRPGGGVTDSQTPPRAPWYAGPYDQEESAAAPATISLLALAAAALSALAL